MANLIDGGRRWPAVEIVEESPREGMQIESRSITTAQKIELTNRLSRTGLTHIVVGINLRQSQEIARWPEIVRSAADAGARAAGIAIDAAWGSNWRGEFSQQERSRLLAEQWRAQDPLYELPDASDNQDGRTHER